MSTRLSMAYFRGGQADSHVAAQFHDAFNEMVSADDPDFGHVVIAAGIHGVFEPERGDINLYWWWSGSAQDDWLEYYVQKASVKPSAILCTSHKMYRFARRRGYKALHLAMATGPDFYPLDLPRSGVGYCGAAAGHKGPQQEACIIEPARAYGLEWLTHVTGGRVGLNEFYNRKSVCLGMTAPVTLSWGIVPNRAYDVLAGANPYLTARHWAMEDEMGFAYPYQSDNAAETVAWIEELIDNPAAHQAEFTRYSEMIRAKHTWANRVSALREFIEREL